MTYDRTAIMQAAWAIVRRADVARHGLRLILRNAMRTAWARAKAAVREARWAAEAVKPRTEADRIRDAIRDMECKDRLTAPDWRHLDALRAELRAVEYRAAA